MFARGSLERNLGALSVVIVTRCVRFVGAECVTVPVYYFSNLRSPHAMMVAIAVADS